VAPTLPTTRAPSLGPGLAANKSWGMRRVEESASTRFPTNSIRDYDFRAFMKWIREVRQESTYDPGPSPKRWAFWRTIPSQTFPPEAGMALLQRYLAAVGDDLRELVSMASLPCWLYVIRRLAPVPIGEDPRPATVLHTRAALEAAVQKWAPLALCHRIAKSSDVPPHSILRGELVTERDEQMLKTLRAFPQLALTDFGREDLLTVVAAEKLGYECWRSMANLRSLGASKSLASPASVKPSAIR
jgi:hypothetical protein